MSQCHCDNVMNIDVSQFVHQGALCNRPAVLLFHQLDHQTQESEEWAMETEQKPSEEKQETTAPSQPERQQLDKISVL